MKTGKLGITGLAGIHYYVRDLARQRIGTVERALMTNGHSDHLSSSRPT